MTNDLWASESMVTFGEQSQLHGIKRRTRTAVGGQVSTFYGRQNRGSEWRRRPASQTEGLVWTRKEDTPFSETQGRQRQWESIETST